MNVLFESINNVQKTQIHCRYLYLKYSHKVSYIPFSYETFQTVNTLRALIVVILRITSYLRICLFAFIDLCTHLLVSSANLHSKLGCSL